MMRIIFVICFLAFLHGLAAQRCPRLEAELALIQFGNPAIPDNLTGSRSAVMISHEQSPVGEDWKKLAEDIHGSLVQMSIDPVVYVNAFDYYASSIISQQFEATLKQRQITNLFVLTIKADYEVELVLVPYAQYVARKGNARGWRATGAGPAGVLYQLGVAVKQAQLQSSNFLILTQPEFLEDVTLFKGDRLANWAGAMRRQKVGLVLMEEIQIPTSVTGSQRELIEAYNADVQAINVQLQEAFEEFEYEWQPIVYRNDQAAMGDRIQYLVFMLHTSGEHIRKILNYPIEKNETEYLSVTPGLSEGDVTLKRLDANSLMYKVYVRRTRSEDVFVGEDWDADDTAVGALRNFIFTWKRQVEGTR